MSAAERVTPLEARDRIAAGAYLVCAYGKAEKFARVKLPGARFIDDFRAEVGGLAKDQEIIFY